MAIIEYVDTHICFSKIMNKKNNDMNRLMVSCRRCALMLAFLGGLVSLLSCGNKDKGDKAAGFTEDLNAKKMLQGIWLNDDADDVAFRVKGDTIYYPDSTSQPMYFYIASDTLVMRGASEVKYPIVKQAAHLFEFKNQGGDIIKLIKTSDQSYLKAFVQQQPVALNQNQLIKRDSVVAFGDEKYHVYVQVNPTSYKVFKSAYNDDGVQVENVYYDNIVNLNIYNGANKLFSRDFHRADFSKKVPKEFLNEAILSDLVFGKIDKDGVHYFAVLAQPDSNISYQVEVIVSFKGQMKIQSVGA